MTDTRILTALYPDHATAERAAERLRAVGVPQENIELHRSETGDVAPGGHLTGGGLFGALSGLLMPEPDVRTYQREFDRGSTVLVASHVAAELTDEAHAALNQDALELDDERDPSPEPAAGILRSRSRSYPPR